MEIEKVDEYIRATVEVERADQRLRDAQQARVDANESVKRLDPPFMSSVGNNIPEKLFRSSGSEFVVVQKRDSITTIKVVTPDN